MLLPCKTPRTQRPHSEEESVKTVSRFLSPFATGLKPGVNEMSRFSGFWGNAPAAESVSTMADLPR